MKMDAEQVAEFIVERLNDEDMIRELVETKSYSKVITFRVTVQATMDFEVV